MWNAATEHVIIIEIESLSCEKWIWFNYAQIHLKWCVEIDMEIQPKNNQILKLIYFATATIRNRLKNWEEYILFNSLFKK